MLKENKKIVERLYRWSRTRPFGATISPMIDPKPEPSSLKNGSSAPSAMYGSEGFRRRFQNENPTPNSEYEIDPITNRKVYKNVSERVKETPHQPNEIPVKTFKGYRSQFNRFGPPEPIPEEKPPHPLNSNPIPVELDLVQEGLKVSQHPKCHRYFFSLSKTLGIQIWSSLCVSRYSRDICLIYSESGTLTQVCRNMIPGLITRMVVFMMSQPLRSTMMNVAMASRIMMTNCPRKSNSVVSTVVNLATIPVPMRQRYIIKIQSKIRCITMKLLSSALRT
jgi:hypothetical protein